MTKKTNKTQSEPIEAQSIDDLLEADDELEQEPEQAQSGQSEKEKRKVGRPAWIPEGFELEQAEKLAGLGMNMQQIAEALGIHYATLAEKRHEYPELDEAIKRGKAKGVAHVAGKLMAKITSMDTTSIIFYLKTQAGWKETQHIELDANIDYSELTDEQLIAITQGKGASRA